MLSWSRCLPPIHRVSSLEEARQAVNNPTNEYSCREREREMTNLKDLQFHKMHTVKDSAPGREIGETPRRPFFKRNLQDELKLCRQNVRGTINLSGGRCKKLQKDGTHTFRLCTGKPLWSRKRERGRERGKWADAREPTSSRSVYRPLWFILKICLLSWTNVHLWTIMPSDEHWAISGDTVGCHRLIVLLVFHW